MKLISLNTWGGRAGLEGLKKFFEKYQDVEIFCLQEIWQVHDLSLIEMWDQRIVTNLLAKISSFLPNHQFFFRPQYRNIYGLATFVHKSIAVKEECELFVFREQGFENPISIGNHARNIQSLTFDLPSGPMTIINFHGLWNGQGKTDSLDRIEQSTKIAEFVRQFSHPVLLLGDFNLLPDTQSFRILTEACPRDLISEHGITSTRSSYYPKSEKLADYAFASAHLEIGDFKVLPYEISDHLALSISVVI